MITLTDNIKEQMAKHRYTAVRIDKELGFPSGTMAQKLHRNGKDVDNGFTVSDIAKLIKLFGCTCTAIFHNVDFKDQ